MTEQTDAAEVEGRAFAAEKIRDLLADMGLDYGTRNRIAWRLIEAGVGDKAAAEARGAERALREAAEDVFRAASASGGSPVFRSEIADWLRARAAAAGGA